MLRAEEVSKGSDSFFLAPPGATALTLPSFFARNCSLVRALVGSTAVSQDTLSDVLRAVRLRGSVFFNVSGSGDWAAEAPPAKEIAPLLMPGVEHVIEYHAAGARQLLGAIPGGPSVHMASRRHRDVPAR